ncbi:MAG TPA: alpha-L-fucosidase [Verrucomicrobiae bacterium]|nr:alpha-L-fucosidase [Verrucomicrobiae bacterium]
MKINGFRHAVMAVALTVTFASCQSIPKPKTPATETKEQRDERMQWWREAKFGMFIHWGVYAVPAGVYHGQPSHHAGEWIMFDDKIPVAEYRQFARQFDPIHYNPDAWVKLAQEAGMRYMVITAKHHDGFALFQTSASDWNAIDATPYADDLIKPLAEAARRHGMKFGLYYSQSQDWVNPGGAKNHMPDGDGWDDAQKGRYDDYLKNVAIPQVREILTQYQPDILWWDTTRMMTPERAKPLHDLLALRPGIITNNRLGGGYAGDTETPEQFIPAAGYPGRDWEACMTMNDTWGYKSNDTNWKSTETLLHNLIDIVSKGGNYLLNVGPTADGVIPQASIERLHQIGAWMKVNDEAIYGTTASPFHRQLPWGRCTQKPGRLYLHVFNWPKDGRLLVPIGNSVTKAYLLAAPQEALATSRVEDGVVIQLPGSAPDPIASVVVAEVDGKPDALAQPITAFDDGSIRLNAADADIHGSTVKLEGRREANIGQWSNATDSVSWPVRINIAGSYLVRIVYACETNTAGSAYTLTVGDQALHGEVAPTGAKADVYKTFPIGAVNIEKPGVIEVTLQPTSKPGPTVMNMRTVILDPRKNPGDDEPQ